MRPYCILIVGGLILLCTAAFAHDAHQHLKDAKTEKLLSLEKLVRNDFPISNFDLPYPTQCVYAADEQKARELPSLKPTAVLHGFYAYQRQVREKPRICQSRGTATVLS